MYCVHLSITHHGATTVRLKGEKKRRRGEKKRRGEEEKEREERRGGKDSTPEAQKVGPERGERSIPARASFMRRRCSELLLRGNLSSGTASFEWSLPNNSVTWFGHHGGASVSTGTAKRARSASKAQFEASLLTEALRTPPKR